MIEVPNGNNEYLNKLRYEKGYNPFSFGFDAEKNRQLLEVAQGNNEATNIVNLIKSGNIFHQRFHILLVKQLSVLLLQIHLKKEDIISLFLALLNQQQQGIRKKKEKLIIQKDVFSAGDIHNASEIIKDHQDTINNLTHQSEELIEYGNLLCNFIYSSNLEFTAVSTDNKLDTFDILFDVFRCVNKYHLVKSFYGDCLSFAGDIRIDEDKEIHFDTGVDEFAIIQSTSTTVIENQRFNRLAYYKFLGENGAFQKNIPQNNNSKILNKALLVNGFITYNLRDRNPYDYHIYIDYLATIHDYYPFYTNEVLQRLNGLTITKILILHSELKNLIEEIYLNPLPDAGYESTTGFTKHYLPKIAKADLKDYLLNVSTCTGVEVDTFIQLLTFKGSGKENLYASPIIHDKECCYFPYFTITNANYLYLIDHWLTMAGLSIEKRGKALERFVRDKLLSAPDNGNNKFNLIQQNNFTARDFSEEIDLILETEKTFIIAEVKCIKYPMYSRDYPSIFAKSIVEAEKQLNRKTKFLTDNQQFFQSIDSIGLKKVIKVIILNIPVFTGATINGIPIIDANFFTVYFQSNRVVKREMGEHEIKEVGEILLYKTETEFCDNFEDYLHNQPVVKLFSGQFETRWSSIKMEGLPILSFSNIYPIDPAHILVEE